MVQQGEGASILSPMVFLDWDGVFRLPEDLYVFRILEIQPSVVGVAYLTDVQLTHYEEEMIEIIREKYLRYGEAIVQAGLKQKT
jgi:hypothetical protein